MSAQRKPILVRALALLVCANLAASCPHEYEGSYTWYEADLPRDTASVKAEVRVVVPEGDWEFKFDWASELVIASAGPRENLTGAGERDSGVFAPFGYMLHCPRGKCPFVFEVAARRTGSSELKLRAGIYFKDLDQGGEQGEGCNRTDPDYVPEQERARLFQVTFTTSEIVLSPTDAGVSNSARDAGWDATTARDSGTDGSVARDAGVDASAALDAGFPLTANGEDGGGANGDAEIDTASDARSEGSFE